MIENAEGKCDGAITWRARKQYSSIDYSLMSPGIYERLTTMKVDEDGTGNVGSDHNRLRLILAIHDKIEWRNRIRSSVPVVRQRGRQRGWQRG